MFRKNVEIRKSVKSEKFGATRKIQKIIRFGKNKTFEKIGGHRGVPGKDENEINGTSAKIPGTQKQYIRKCQGYRGVPENMEIKESCTSEKFGAPRKCRKT